MRLILIDKYPDTRSALLGRVQEGMRQGGVRRVELDQVEIAEIRNVNWEQVIGCLIGPGCYDDLEHVVEVIKMQFAGGAIGAVLENDVYAGEAVGLKRKLAIEIIALSDLAQIAGFLIRCDDAVEGGASGSRSRGVIGVCQFKGGVGVTSVVSALAGCWARHQLSVACIDCDDVNPQLTNWARVGTAQRAVCAEFLRTGQVPPLRINELVFPVESFEGRLVVVGQPENYNERFHYKANVLEEAPSASDFITSLIESLRAEFDVIVVDLARSWGVATFTTLPLCQHVIMVTDDDGMSVRATLDAIVRMRRESDDPEEFDFKRWSILLNACSGELITPEDLEKEVSALGLFPADSNLFSLPFSAEGRRWGAPGQSFFDAADVNTRNTIRSVAHTLVPFRYQPEESGVGRIGKQLQALLRRKG